MASDGFEKLEVRYPGIQPANEGSNEVCLNQFFMIANGRASIESVHAALMDTDVVDVSPLEGKEDAFRIGCRVADCRMELDLEVGQGFTSANECSLMEWQPSE
jgi:hypothetical protein